MQGAGSLIMLTACSGFASAETAASIQHKNVIAKSFCDVMMPFRAAIEGTWNNETAELNDTAGKFRQCVSRVTSLGVAHDARLIYLCLKTSSVLIGLR